MRFIEFLTEAPQYDKPKPQSSLSEEEILKKFFEYDRNFTRSMEDAFPDGLKVLAVYLPKPDIEVSLSGSMEYNVPYIMRVDTPNDYDSFIIELQNPNTGNMFGNKLGKLTSLKITQTRVLYEPT